MKKEITIQIIIIIIFTAILGILVKFTIEAINLNNMPKMNYMKKQGDNMQGQIGRCF